MTLWELAESWEHDFSHGFGAPRHCEDCRRCQLERWAREKSAACDKVHGFPFESQHAKEISIDFGNFIKAMLGVPEEPK